MGIKKSQHQGPPGIHIHEDFIQYLHHRPRDGRNGEISEPAGETKPTRVLSATAMVTNISRKSKSQVSKQGGGSWASLDKLRGNTCRDNNLNPAYVMLNSWESQLQILESSLTAI